MSVTNRPASTRSDTPLAAAVLRALKGHVGQANAIRRGELEMHVRGELFQSWQRHEIEIVGKVTDRRVRNALAQLAMSDGPGALVCSTLDGHGYYLAANETEIDGYLDNLWRRGITILRRRRAQKRAARREFDRRQMELFPVRAPVGARNDAHDGMIWSE